MRTLIVAITAFVLATGSLFAQDVLERPISTTSTSATVNVTFPFTLGYVQDVILLSGMGANTATVSIVNYNLGATNTVATWVFTNSSQNRISSAWPVEKEDVVRALFTGSTTNKNNTVSVWFKNVNK